MFRFADRDTFWHLVGIGLIVATFGVIGLIGYGVFVVLPEQGEMIRDAYCLDWASAAIVQYIDDHEGEYPRSWDALEESVDKVTARDRSFSFEEIRSRVAVDFTVDPHADHDPSF